MFGLPHCLQSTGLHLLLAKLPALRERMLLLTGRSLFVALLCLLAGNRALASSAMPTTLPPVAEQPVREVSWRMQTVGTDQGLSQSSVYGMVQDRFGFVWLATDDGLNRFDGHRWQQWQRNDRGLSRGSLRSLCLDTDDQLWLGLFDGGAHRLDTKQLKLSPVIPPDAGEQGVLAGAVNACLDDGNGNVWLATDSGLSQYDRTRQRFEHWPLPGAAPSGARLLDLQKSADGSLFALGNQGIYRIENGLQPETVPATLLGRGQLTAFLVEADTVLIGTDRAGLWRWSRASDQLQRLNWPIDDGAGISRLLRDREQRLWLGTERHGVFMQASDGAEWQSLHHDPGRSDSLADNHIRSLFQSREGVIWIGTWLAGVSRFDPLQTSFAILQSRPSQPDSLPVSSVRAVLAEADRLWVGTDGGGLSVSTDDGLHFRHFVKQRGVADSLADNHVRFIHRDRRGRLWLGTENGLDQFDNGRFRHVRLSANWLGQSDQQLRAIAEAGDGTLWLGTWGAGLLRYNPALDRTEQWLKTPEQPEMLCGNRVVALRLDQDESLLIGTDDGGLCRRRPDGSMQRLLPANFAVWSLHSDAEAIWIGTYGDTLIKQHRRSEKRYRFDRDHGLGNDVIYAIIPDADGKLWLSSNDGLFRFDPNTERADRFPVSSGLQDREFNSGAAGRGPDGRLYFGGIKGLNVFRPEQVALNRIAPVSTITGLSVMQKDWPEPAHALTSLRLLPDQNSLSIRFSAQHFSTPDGNQYQYRLLPVESDWNSANARQTEVHYSQLPAGDYQFELRSGSAAGVWDPDIRRLAITIQPSFWQRQEAIGLYAVLLMAAVLLAWYRQRRLRQRDAMLREQLQQEVALRTQQLQEKHDALEQLNRDLQHANERLDTMSLTDPLTGLGNRRMLVRYLEKDSPSVLRRHQDANTAPKPPANADLLFFLIDIDHFKRINDSFGHSIGDEVLLGVKDRLQNICREQDYLVRYGGEEFLLVSRFSDRQHSPQLAERIRSIISDQPFLLSNGVRLPVTVSTGFAAFPLHLKNTTAYSTDQVLQVADCLLYTAKNSGRNQWVGAQQAHEERAELLLSRLRENGELAISQGDIDITSLQRSNKRLRWRDQSPPSVDTKASGPEK